MQGTEDRTQQLLAARGCPVVHEAFPHHEAFSQKKTGLAELAGPALERAADGTWYVRDFALTRQLLRSGETRQAGFKADLLAQMPQVMRQPILYQDGKAHHEQRRQTARFFAPKTVSAQYRVLMEELAERLIGRLRSAGEIDFSQITLEMAVNVAARVIGLTHSQRAGMHRRLDAFFKHEIVPFGRSPRALWHFVGNQSRILAFFWLDVRPAIRAHRRAPGDDLISHLLAQGYSEGEILTECVTFAAAGMATTREFIGMAAWHLLEHPRLRARYLESGEEERHAILGEILRLEPVVGHIYRRAATDLSLTYRGETVVIPRGSLLDLHIHSANVDAQIAGEHALQVCPARKLAGERIPPEMMSFGDGYHRCPGSYLAIQETDILLTRLLALPGLRIKRLPTMGWNNTTAGYELRNFVLALA